MACVRTCLDASPHLCRIGGLVHVFVRSRSFVCSSVRPHLSVRSSVRSAVRLSVRSFAYKASNLMIATFTDSE